jgi:hypothetical protein
MLTARLAIAPEAFSANEWAEANAGSTVAKGGDRSPERAGKLLQISSKTTCATIVQM